MRFEGERFENEELAALARALDGEEDAPRLELESGGVLLLRSGAEVRIGGAPWCELRIEDPRDEVARVARSWEGRTTVRASARGLVEVRGELLAEELRVHHGDEIVLRAGGGAVRVRYVDPVEELASLVGARETPDAGAMASAPADRKEPFLTPVEAGLAAAAILVAVAFLVVLVVAFTGR